MINNLIIGSCAFTAAKANVSCQKYSANSYLYIYVFIILQYKRIKPMPTIVNCCLAMHFLYNPLMLRPFNTPMLGVKVHFLPSPTFHRHFNSLHWRRPYIRPDRQN